MRRPLIVVLAAGLVAGCTASVTTQSPGSGPNPRANPSASVHTLGVPPGHLPPPGQCRVWIPGTPPGRQARARSCSGIIATAPPGSWVLYRPSRDRTVIRVHYVDTVRKGIVVTVRFFEPSSGAFLREASPSAYRDFGEDEDDDGGRR